MQSAKEQTCPECVRPNCNGQRHLTEDAYLGCSQCGIELNDIIELIENESLRNSKQCEICDHIYSDSECPDDHFLSHFYGQPAKVFLCIDCESVDSTETEYEELEALATTTFMYPCETCTDVVFTSKRLLNNHILQFHPADVRTDFRCRVCNKEFDTASKLSYHRVKNHPKPQVEKHETFPCRVCDEEEIFGSKAERNQHENQIHRDYETKLFNCPFCERTFPSVSVMANHLLKHTKKRTHTCEICHKSFGRLCHLDYHRTTHTDQKLFECILCDGKTFKTANSLNLHVIRMHTDRPGYPCDMCDKVFKDTSDRRRHRWTHGGVPKNFACDICEKRFYERKAVRLHMRVHSKKIDEGHVKVYKLLQTIDDEVEM